MIYKFKLLTLLTVFFVGVFSFSNFAYADNVGLNWAKSVGGDGIDKGLRIETDSSGNVYTLGLFSSTADLDPSSGTANFTSVGLADIFLTKFDSSGNFVWAKQIGSTGDEWAQAMDFDSLGNIYISGRFADTADFDPGAGTTELTSAGGNDNFILKLDSSGDFVWVKQFGGTGAEDSMSLLIDSNDNIHLFGNFSATVDFDPGAGTTELTSAGSVDIFILRLDSNGDFVWVKQIGSTGWGDLPRGALIDSSDNIYVTGTFQNTVDFDPGAGTSNLIATGTLDAFALKLDSNGDFAWAKTFSSSNRVYGNRIMVDNSGNVYVSGTFNATVDVDPGAGTTTLTTAGSYDLFVTKLDSSGDFVWAKQIGGTGNEWAVGFSFDSSYNMYLSGRFYSTVDFDPGAGTTELTSNGTSDIFVLKLDSSGDFVWVKQFGGTSDDESMYFNIDTSNNLYVTGYFSTTTDFDPGAGTTELTSAGNYDTFILKLSPIVVPTLTTSSASSIERYGGALNGNITSTGYDVNTTRGFQYGLTDSYGSTSSETGTFSTGTYQATLTGLNCNRTYHYRAFSSNSEGTGYGSDGTFNTGSCITSFGSSYSSRVNNLISMGKTQEAQSLTNIVKNTTTLQPNTFISPVDNQIKSCPSFSKYFKYGSKNDEIKLWQAFLNKEVGTNLSIDGSFGPATKKAVILFQEKYKSDILTPWKISKGTGYIYQSTRFKANELMGCSRDSILLDNGITLKK